jgi:nucleoside-diphosphate-sugar epimerase
MSQKVIITGSSGYLGLNLMNFLLDRDLYVYAFQRKKLNLKHKNLEFIQYDLESELEDTPFIEADFLFHTAFKSLLTRKEKDVNFSGTKKLLQKCRQFNVKIIFFSTVSAQEEIPSRYAKSKIKIENLLDIQKDIILKLGLVIGNGGLFLKMYSFIKKSSLIPIFDNGKQALQYISLMDVCETCFETIHHFNPGIYVIVKGDTILMRNFYSKLAVHQQRRVFFINISSTFFYKILKTTESLHIPLPVSSENLLGLKKMTSLPQKLFNTRIDKEIKTLKECLTTIK